MTTTRLEAFSDAVIAIVMTIMVLELHVPQDHTLTALRPLVPELLTYLLSFVFLGIYWNNHHHLMHVTERVDGAILWANMHLLFWLSLVPFTTGWLGESHFAPVPAACYGVVQLLAAIAFRILVGAILAREGPDSRLRAAVGRDFKGWLSIGLYAAGVAVSFVSPAVGLACYVVVALIWLVPDRRIERRLS